MTQFAIRPEDLQNTLAAALGDRVSSITIALGEVSVSSPKAACNCLTLSPNTSCRAASSA